jgi:hypothetical protein
VKFRYVFLTAVIFALTSYSCGEKSRKPVHQGEIHYSVRYTGKVTLMPRELMPRNLVVAFKSDKIIYELISPIGNSGIINLSNPSKEIYDTYLSMFTIRYFYPSKQESGIPDLQAMKSIEIKKLKTCIKCGFFCKNAEVTFPFDRNKIYNVWYTNDIRVKNPNNSTPFEEIDKVMLAFLLYRRSEFHFEAEMFIGGYSEQNIRKEGKVLRYQKRYK